jgi:hypothetical protein
VYVAELKRLKKNISYNAKELQKTKDEKLRYEVLSSLQKDIENFNKHKIVALFLGGKDLPSISITISLVQNELQKLHNNISSIDLATKITTKDIKQKKIYLSAI